MAVLWPTSPLIKRLGDVVLFDVVDGMPQGKALDLRGIVARSRVSTRRSPAPTIWPTSRARDVCIVTAGLPRQAGHEPRRPPGDQREGHEERRQRASRSTPPNAFVIVDYQPARRHGHRDEAGHRLRQAEAWSARPACWTRPGNRTFVALGTQGVGAECLGHRARRPWRRHGAGAQPLPCWRRAGRKADQAGSTWLDAIEKRDARRRRRDRPT